MTSSPNDPFKTLHTDETILDRLLASLDLHVSGACGSNYLQPRDLFQPSVRTYNGASPDPASPGSPLVGSNERTQACELRTVPSAAARDGYAVVQDKDVSAEKAFEAALARETIAVAAEAFEDEYPHAGSLDHNPFLEHFEGYVAALGKQTITIPIPTLVDAMLDIYGSVVATSSAFACMAWSQPGPGRTLRTVLEDFVLTRECLFFPPNRMPVVETTFYVNNAHSLTMHYTWSPPRIDFQDLRNVYSEGQAFTLAPTLDRGTRCLGPDLDVRFTTDLSEHLPWNAATHRFEGYWPTQLAGMAGAQRLEAFTMPFNIRAHVTKPFPGDMCFERIIRLAIPVTIRRRPDTCLGESELSRSPQIQRPAYSRLTAGEARPGFPLSERINGRSPEKVASATSTPRKDSLWENCRPIGSERATTCDEGGRCDSCRSSPSPTGKDLGDLLSKKARDGGPASPLRLNSLTLARLWEATAPRAGDVDVACWVVGTPPERRQESGSVKQWLSSISRGRNPLRATSGNQDWDAVKRAEEGKAPPKLGDWNTGSPKAKASTDSVQYEPAHRQQVSRARPPTRMTSSPNSFAILHQLQDDEDARHQSRPSTPKRAHIPLRATSNSSLSVVQGDDADSPLPPSAEVRCRLISGESKSLIYRETGSEPSPDSFETARTVQQHDSRNDLLCEASSPDSPRAIVAATLAALLAPCTQEAYVSPVPSPSLQRPAGEAQEDCAYCGFPHLTSDRAQACMEFHLRNYNSWHGETQKNVMGKWRAGKALDEREKDAVQSVIRHAWVEGMTGERSVGDEVLGEESLVESDVDGMESGSDAGSVD